MFFSGCSKQRVIKEYVCSDGSVVPNPSLCKYDSDKDISGLKVKCSTPADCPYGYCDMSSSNPSDWHCVEGSVPDSYCGDGICDELTENYANCPKDCS